MQCNGAGGGEDEDSDLDFLHGSLWHWSSLCLDQENFQFPQCHSEWLGINDSRARPVDEEDGS